MELTTLAAEASWNKDESLHDLVYLGKSDNRKRLKVVNYSKEQKHPQPLNSKLEKQIIPETIKTIKKLVGAAEICLKQL